MKYIAYVLRNILISKSKKNSTRKINKYKITPNFYDKNRNCRSQWMNSLNYSHEQSLCLNRWPSFRLTIFPLWPSILDSKLNKLLISKLNINLNFLSQIIWLSIFSFVVMHFSQTIILIFPSDNFMVIDIEIRVPFGNALNFSSVTAVFI